MLSLYGEPEHRFMVLPLKKLPSADSDRHIPTPHYASAYASGMDLRANLSKAIMLESLDRVVVRTGVAIAIPNGFEAQVRPRSGLAAQSGLTVLNAPGTIDADYRGEICVIMVNLSRTTQIIEPDQRIAQLVFAPVVPVSFDEVSSLPTVDGNRAGGLGSTGSF